MRFDFEVSGDKLVSRKLVRFGHRALDASPAFRLIADDMRRFERLRFATGGYGTWRPLSASTIEQKASKGLDQRILQATHGLRNSLTETNDPDQELIIRPSFMVFGSKNPIAKYHQDGTDRMPARKPLGFTEPQKRQIIRRVQTHIVSER